MTWCKLLKIMILPWPWFYFFIFFQTCSKPKQNVLMNFDEKASGKLREMATTPHFTPSYPGRIHCWLWSSSTLRNISWRQMGKGRSCGLHGPSTRPRRELGGPKRQGGSGTGTAKETLIPSAVIYKLAWAMLSLLIRQMGKGAPPLLSVEWVCFQVQSGSSTSNKFTRRSNEEYFSYGTRTFCVVISILVLALNVILAKKEVAYEARIKWN